MDSNRADHELWVDQAFDRHYETRHDVEQTLRRIASDSIRQAEAAFAQGRHDEAERPCGIAISADDRRIEPLALKAAIRRTQGNATGESQMAELASRVMDEPSFFALVSRYRPASGGLPERYDGTRSGV